jgi:hypothetical protein
MSGIQTMTVKSGAVLAPTGGSDLVFAPDGQTIQNGVHLVVPAVTDYSIRPQATVKFRAPTIDANGVYSKDKKSISFSIPRKLVSGATVFDVIRIEREVHPETSAANALDMNIVAAQFLFDSEAASFWSAGSLA